ncbi:Calx-beta domain protein [compost metagenome]
MVPEPKFRARLPVTLAAASTAPVTVTASTEDGTAVDGTDYESNPQELVFAPGELTKEAVFVMRNPYSGGPVEFSVKLTAGANAQLGDPSTRIVALRGLAEDVLFRDDFDDTSGGSALWGRQPQVGGVWGPFDPEDPGQEPQISGQHLSLGAGPDEFTYQPLAALARVVLPGSGTVSIKARIDVAWVEPTSNAGRLSFGLGADANEGEWLIVTLEFRDNLITWHVPGGSSSGEIDFDFAPYVENPGFDFEFRWDVDGGLCSIYIDGVVVGGEAVSASLTGVFDEVDMFSHGLQRLDFDNFVITQGGPAAEEVPPVVADPLAWYARSQYGSWSGWNTEIPAGAQEGSYPAASLAARIVDDALTGPVVWTAIWHPAGGVGAFEPSIQFPKGPDPTNVVAGNVDWAKGVDVDGSAMAGEGFGELDLIATVNGVRIPGYLWVTWAAGPQSYATQAWGYSSGEPEPAMLRIYDNFDEGAPGSSFAGRIPAISSTGTAWNTLGALPNANFQISNAQTLRPTAGTEGTPIAYGGLDLPPSSTCKLEFIIRSTAGGPLISANTHIFRAELSLGTNNAKAWLDDGFCYVSSSNNGDQGEELAVMPGAGGAAVKVTIEWGNQLVTMKFNDVLVASTSTFYSEQYPGNPDGSGTFYFEATVGNDIEYIEILQTPLALP